MVVLAHRTRRGGALAVVVPVRRPASLVGRLREDVMEVARLIVGELQGFDVGDRLPPSTAEEPRPFCHQHAAPGIPRSVATLKMLSEHHTTPIA
ncbi:hypothetical protein [Streptomyces sp. NBC_00354]|uniref:hypothetical protein n=1 Tax=Streptomyces sp. NBC_00354 TaxID=2975723 RepID=UPI002E2722F6